MAVEVAGRRTVQAATVDERNAANVWLNTICTAKVQQTRSHRVENLDRVGALRMGSAEARAAILDDINIGIEVGQCARDLRNPQGVCCLGNVRTLIRQLEDLVTQGS